jgi:Ca2+:H+ antiporter
MLVVVKSSCIVDAYIR